LFLDKNAKNTFWTPSIVTISFVQIKIKTDVTQERILQPQNFKSIGVSVKIKGSLSQVMQR
jgi:hypothetical protein